MNDDRNSWVPDSFMWHCRELSLAAEDCGRAIWQALGVERPIRGLLKWMIRHIKWLQVRDV